MELFSEPEEPTSVIQIMKDFGRARTRKSKISRFSFDVDESSDISITEIGKNHDKEVELLTTKARVTKLERQLESVETERKRALIDQEKEVMERQRKIMKMDENNQELQKELKYLLEKEESGREEIAALKKKLDTLQDKYKKDVNELQKDNTSHRNKIEELNEYHRREKQSLMNRIVDNEAIYFKNKAEDYKAQLELLQSKLSKHFDVMQENEKLSERLRQAEHKWKSAEEKISQQEEAFVVAKTMQSQLTKLNELRRQNLKYEEENKLLQDSRENSLLLLEKYDAMKRKYESVVEKLNALSALEIENEELKKKIKRWEIEDSSGNVKARSPIELTRMISDLQKSHLSMVEKQGDLKASVLIKGTSLQSLNEKYSEMRSQFLELQERKTQEAEKCQRLQRRLLLVTADRDGIRRILNNYDTEVSPNHSQQLRSRVQEAEDRLTAANDLINRMEIESDELRKEMHSERLKLLKLQAELEDLKSRPGMTEKDAAEMNNLKSQIADLKKKNESLQESVDILEARIEKRHLQGDFDPTKTKVLHFAGNPVALSRKLHSEEIENLRDENEELRRKIKLLEKGMKHEGTEASTAQTSDDKVIQELKSELKSSNLQNQRLKEVFATSVQDFRESCYQLFGYKNDMIGTKRFQLRSMYAERAEDCFIFQMTPEHQMEMIETDFSLQWKDAMRDYLARGQSIPAFLSSVTLNLFSKQTEIIDTTLAQKFN